MCREKRFVSFFLFGLGIGLLLSLLIAGGFLRVLFGILFLVIAIAIW